MKRIAVIVGGSLLYALATCIFIIPNNVVLGGTSGLSIILQHFFVNISSEQFITLFNVILMILAFAILGRLPLVHSLAVFLPHYLYLFWIFGEINYFGINRTTDKGEKKYDIYKKTGRKTE